VNCFTDQHDPSYAKGAEPRCSVGPREDDLRPQSPTRADQCLGWSGARFGLQDSATAAKHSPCFETPEAAFGTEVAGSNPALPTASLEAVELRWLATTLSRAQSRNLRTGRLQAVRGSETSGT
jgi:hypothetical protein